MTIAYKGTPNKQPRPGSVKFVVCHWFGVGTLESANTRFQNPASQVSAHYGISGNTIYQWARENEIAYHCGDFSCNTNSIGIEHDATTDHNASEVTYATSIELIAEICKRHGISPSVDTIKPHKAFKPTQCPGTLDLQRIIDGVKQKLNTNPMPGYTQEDLLNEGFKVSFETIVGRNPTTDEFNAWRASGKLATTYLKETQLNPALQLEGFKTAYKAAKSEAPTEAQVNAWRTSGKTASVYVRENYLPQLLTVEEKQTLTKAKEIFIKLGA